MSIPLSESIFFAGGKRLEPIIDANSKGVTFERTTDGDWKINIEVSITKDEAEKVLRKFEDFNTPENEFEDKFPNQIYFEAFDNDQPKAIEMDVLKLSVYFDKDDVGGMILSMQPTVTGKTQNSKTQNIEIGQ